MQDIRKRDIRVRADFFREQCKVGRYGILDLFEECERQGYKLLRYPLGEEANLGFVLKKDMDIVIFTNTSSRLSREIFTLAHEIGHVILHMRNSSSFIDDDATISDRNADQIEQEANYFAACLLMPGDEVDKFLDFEIDEYNQRNLSAMDIAKLMSEFKVSFEMAINRLESLNKIDVNKKITLNNDRNEIRVSRLLKNIGDNSHLNEPSNNIFIPYEYMDYAIFNYNHNAIPEETLIETLKCYNLSIDDIQDRLDDKSSMNEDIDELIRGLDV